MRFTLNRTCHLQAAEPRIRGRWGGGRAGCSSSSASVGTRAVLALRSRVKDGHVKDAAQDVADDATQDVAEGVLGAAEDGSSSVSGGKIIITPVACPTAPHPHAPQGFFISGFFIVAPSAL